MVGGSNMIPAIGTRVCVNWVGWKNAIVWCVVGRFHSTECFLYGQQPGCAVLAQVSAEDHKTIETPERLRLVTHEFTPNAPRYPVGSILEISSKTRHVVEEYDGRGNLVLFQWKYKLRNKQDGKILSMTQEELIAKVTCIIDAHTPETTKTADQTEQKDASEKGASTTRDKDTVKGEAEETKDGATVSSTGSSTKLEWMAEKLKKARAKLSDDVQRVEKEDTRLLEEGNVREAEAKLREAKAKRSRNVEAQKKAKAKLAEKTKALDEMEEELDKMAGVLEVMDGRANQLFGEADTPNPAEGDTNDTPSGAGQTSEADRAAKRQRTG
jgi:hypothetical protein